MTLLLPFAATLFVASLLSGIARRTVLSTAVLFLLAGVVLGSAGLDLIDVQPDDPLVGRLVELALFVVLFTDGMRSPVQELWEQWRLPGRALFVGMPLTFGLMAVLGRFLLGLSWPVALLLAAALSPTDPVFARALIGRENVPLRLRRLLNVESGLNDGLALPVVILTLSLIQAGGEPWQTIVVNLLLGVIVGIAVPALALGLQRLLSLPLSQRYQPLGVVAIGLLVLAFGLSTQVNLFLAAFTAGITVVSISSEAPNVFEPFGEVSSELLKLLALLLFGALISLEVIGQRFDLAEYLFVALTLIAVRPLALLVALFGAGLTRNEWLAVAWFGPKGFASMVYGLFILKSGIDQGPYLFHLIAFVVGLSIIAHSSTDVVVARRFRQEDGGREGS